MKPAPLLGQHGEEVLAEWLNLDKDKIGALRNDKVVGLMAHQFLHRPG